MDSAELAHQRIRSGSEGAKSSAASRVERQSWRGNESQPQGCERGPLVQEKKASLGDMYAALWKFTDPWTYAVRRANELGDECDYLLDDALASGAMRGEVDVCLRFRGFGMYAALK